MSAASTSKLLRRALSVPTSNGGPSAFTLPVKRLVLTYGETWGSNRGMKNFIVNNLVGVAQRNPGVEVVVKRVENEHPSLRGVYVNGRDKVICVRNLEPSAIERKAQLLLDSSGAKIGAQRRPTVSTAAKLFADFADPVKGLDGVIPSSLLQRVVKAGFVFSARAGSGLVIARLADGTWSAPSAIGTAGGGVGLQVGVEMAEFIIILNSRAAVKSFMAAGSLTLGGNMSIAAGPVGRNVEGTGSLSTKATQLLSGQVEVPPFADQLIDTITRRSGTAMAWAASTPTDEYGDPIDDPDADMVRPPNPNRGYSFGTAYASGGASSPGSSSPSLSKSGGKFNFMNRSRSNSGAVSVEGGRSRSGSGTTTGGGPAFASGGYKFDTEFTDDFDRRFEEQQKNLSLGSRSRANSGASTKTATAKLTKPRSGSLLGPARSTSQNFAWDSSRDNARDSFDSLDDDDGRGRYGRFGSDDDEPRKKAPIRFPNATPPSGSKTKKAAATRSPFDDDAEERPGLKSNKSYSTKPWDSEDEDLMSMAPVNPPVSSPSRADPFDFTQVEVDFERSAGGRGGYANLSPGTAASRNQARSRSQSAPKGLGTAIALFDFDSVEPGDLSFKKGDAITITKQDDEEWWTGRLKMAEGLLPRNRVEFHPVSTSALPATPSPVQKPPTFKQPRGGKGKFKESLGGVLEEEGEEVISIVRGPERAPGDDEETTYWALLAREEISIWSVRPKAVLAKLRRTPLSLRTQGSNASVIFHSPTQLVVTTTAGHHLLYSISPATALGGRKSTQAYVLPGGEKGAKAWPDGPGEGKGVSGVILRGEGERGMPLGDGVGCVCATPESLLVAIQDPPSLRIIPFPSFHSPGHTPPLPPPQSPVNRRHERRSSAWTGLSSGMAGGGQSEAVVLDEWKWLVGNEGDVTISELILLPPRPDDEPSTSRPSTPTSTAFPGIPPAPPKRTPHDFVMLTSDGRSYLVHWGPDPNPSHTPRTPSTPEFRKLSLASPGPEPGSILFDEKVELRAQEEEEEKWIWSGVCFHPRRTLEGEDGVAEQEKELDKGKGGSTIGVSEKMGLVAVGCEDGTTSVYNLYPLTTVPSSSTSPSPITPAHSHTLSLRSSLNSTASGLATGRVTCLSWTSDGYGLAVGWALGWSIWSVYGRLGSWSVAGSLSSGYGVEGEKSDAFEDHFMHGVRNLFWSPGNLELYVLCPPPIHPKKKSHDEQLFVIPFAKSAVTSLHTPDNTKHAFLQMDDRVLVYRGADQPDMSVINPESDVWQHIKIPAAYIALHHPIRYAAISGDARLIAVSGRRGLAHYNALSGRWKLFENEKEEDAIRVVGGMAWWSNVLIVACVENGVYQIRLFSRDKPLSLLESLEAVGLESEPLLLSVFDSSLLVYTADNTFHHFLIRQTRNGARLRVCGSIGFEGVVADPTKVRGMSWLVPKSQQRFGDPADDLNVATIIFLINGKLVLLRPRRAVHEEVKYDMQILADRIEFYWTSLSGIGTLENSLWGWDGNQIRIWLDALTIEKVRVDQRRDVYESVSESVGIDVDFYPLAVLMDKGIIVGVDQETSLRKSLDFAMFRIITTTHLFIHHILRFHLTRNQRKEAVLFASHYQSLVYFAHALEILLHAVLEDEADARPPPSRPATPVGSAAAEAEAEAAVLPRVVEFLDHFDEALQVVVGCARKTEVARWSFLFDVVGKPRDLFEKCISSGFLKVAASYLLVLHNLEPLEQSSKDTVRLLKAAMAAGEWMELLRFLYSLDRTGLILRTALSEGSALPPGYLPPSFADHPADTAFRRSISSPAPLSSFISGENGQPEYLPNGGGDGERPYLPRSPSMPNGGQSNALGLGTLMGRAGQSPPSATRALPDVTQHRCRRRMAEESKAAQKHKIEKLPKWLQAWLKDNHGPTALGFRVQHLSPLSPIGTAGLNSRQLLRATKVEDLRDTLCSLGAHLPQSRFTLNTTPSIPL
ncbi:ribosome control protein 1 domain containing protein [Pseudohyphozyma bogoriensis]|nr:ribosome control protein 1 domain containing protein [Pseudohyphozyma bogoriensis]